MTTKNETTALLDVLTKINNNGTTVITRGFEQKEILANLENITEPQNRVIILHNRGNNIFALIAETLWVLAGRNDMEYLTRYLPRATDFSDDGKVWRAAYGPRLRNWKGVDQFKGVRDRILEDKNTKRAVMNIFDPEQDYVDSLDIPCNNWLHFMARDGKLNLDVAVRANDAIWGFGGINTFEWSVLLQLMSFWTNKEVGRMNWFTGTIHVYDRHYKKMQRILENNDFQTLYDFGISAPRFQTSLEDFDYQLQTIFEIEKKMRDDINDQSIKTQIEALEDPLLQTFIAMLYSYNVYLETENIDKVIAIVNSLEESDLKVAAIEFYSRKFSDHNMFDLSTKETQFFSHYWNSVK